MSKISVLDIDLAKNVFQLHGTDEKGKTVLQKRLSRNKLAEFICNILPCFIEMEACGGAHYWARKFESFGHKVKLMSPQYVKPYVKTNKNDMNDAEAICEAVTRPSMCFVPIKTIEQQDIQAVHRIRSRLMAQRTGLVNQVRVLLAEYGVVMAQRISKRGDRYLRTLLIHGARAFISLSKRKSNSTLRQTESLCGEKSG